ncbi:MAG TPA: SBBP repeat-containing protein [Thermoanaerobaculia bacterium]|nr:SBBP repeat-containing protein [Thermoanaerobaculia bacterium]
MRSTMDHFAPTWHRALLGALTILMAATPALADSTPLFSTYLGGSRQDIGDAVAVQGGNTYVAGTTYSANYPVFMVSSSKPDEINNDAFVTALSSSGTPIYSRYLPLGGGNEAVVGIGVTADGSAYVAGEAFAGGESYIVVVKLEPWGAVAWRRETYGRLSAGGMTVDSQGNVYVTGRSTNPDENYDYRDYAYVWKLDASGATSYWAEIDGNYSEHGEDVAVDASGNAYVTGITISDNLPRSIQPAAPGGYNAFVTKLDPAGAILWSTYLGGIGDEFGDQIEVAPDGSLVVAGTTNYSDFRTLNAIQAEHQGEQDLFLVRLRPWGSLISSTYLGGSSNDSVTALALDASSILLAVSSSPEDGFPLPEPLDPSCGGMFVAKLDATASRVLDAACLGNSRIHGVAVDSSGVSLTGVTDDSLPLANAWQPAYGGNGDAFAAKLTLNNTPDCSAAAASPATLSPADGRFVNVSIRGVTDPDGDRVTITLTSIFQDEFLTSPGTPDAGGVGTPTARLRASRIPGGDGRVYHLRYTATDTQGGTCSGTVKVCVPLSGGGTCVDGGARIDSTRAY